MGDETAEDGGTNRAAGEDRRLRLLQLLAGAAAAVSAIATFLGIFVVEVPVGDEVTGAARSATIWSAGLRTGAGGSYGMILTVAAPAALAVTLLAGRWWRSTLMAATVVSVHQLGSIPGSLRFQREIGEYAAQTWQLRGLLGLAVAIILGYLVFFGSGSGGSTGDRRPRYREMVMAAAAFVMWALTWGMPQMFFDRNDLRPREETHGVLHLLPLTDLDRISDLPFDYLAGYLPGVLVVAASLGMLFGGGRRHPAARVGVWVGLAVGVLADVVQRVPAWYDPAPFGTAGGPGYPAELVGTWSPARVPLVLLLASAIALVCAAWSAWLDVEPAEEAEPLPSIEIVDPDTDPLWGQRP